MIGSRCYGQTLHLTHSILTVNSNVSRIINGIANRLYYSKDKGQKTCSENVPQTSGKQVESWPKSDPPPPAWRCECPSEPQPPNYDPYRIKVPDVVVPPMPPSNAKWSGVVLMTTDPEADQRRQQELEQQRYQHQCGHQPEETAEDVPTKKEGIMGLLKGFLGKLGGKKKGEGDAMMLDSREILNEDARKLFKNPEMNFHTDFQSCAYRVQDLFHNSPFVHPDYWKDKPVRKFTEAVKDVLPKLGYHGRNKYKYAFHEPWRPLDRMALLEQAEKQELGQLDEPSGDAKPSKKQTTELGL